MRTCVTPDGTFCYGIHSPSYTVRLLRRRSRIESLGSCENGSEVLNTANYPDGDVAVPEADRIYEIANALPFRGTTYIGKAWADRSSAEPERIRIPAPPPVSLTALLAGHGQPATLIESLPRPLRLALATTSTDPRRPGPVGPLQLLFYRRRRRPADRPLLSMRRGQHAATGHRRPRPVRSSGQQPGPARRVQDRHGHSPRRPGRQRNRRRPP